jgi:hypothetical protein
MKISLGVLLSLCHNSLQGLRSNLEGCPGKARLAAQCGETHALQKQRIAIAKKVIRQFKAEVRSFGRQRSISPNHPPGLASSQELVAKALLNCVLEACLEFF